MKSKQTDKQLTKEAWLVRERAIEDDQRVAKTKRAEKSAAEETAQLAKEQVRKEAWLARERIIEEDRNARKIRESEKRE